MSKTWKDKWVRQEQIVLTVIHRVSFYWDVRNAPRQSLGCPSTDPSHATSTGMERKAGNKMVIVTSGCKITFRINDAPSVTSLRLSHLLDKARQGRKKVLCRLDGKMYGSFTAFICCCTQGRDINLTFWTTWEQEGKKCSSECTKKALPLSSLMDRLMKPTNKYLEEGLGELLTAARSS